MNNLMLKYNDTAYFQITDALQKSFVNSIKKSIEKALTPLREDIERANGYVQINYKNHRLEVTTYQLPLTLEQKIKRILN